MNKLFIKNRHGLKICVVIEGNESAKDLAFVLHGLGGSKDQAHIRKMVEAFLERDFTVVSFDATNSFGESEGKYDDATTTNYIEDLEDVISWAGTQTWYKEPFFLVGHSLGAIASAMYSAKNPTKVKGLAPIGTVVSGKLTLETDKDIEKWKELGYREKTSRSNPGRTGRLKWSHMEDRLKYDLIPLADKLTMPVLMIVGSEDIPCPPRHEKLLFDVLPGRKEFHVVEGAPHTFKTEQELKALFDLMTKWIASFGL